MIILCTFAGGMLGEVFLIVFDIMSFILFGRSILYPIFGHSGLEALIAPMAGCILGWIWGNKLKDYKEQISINRELEQDRIRYEDIKSPD
jgi:hypothetical protein